MLCCSSMTLLLLRMHMPRWRPSGSPLRSSKLDISMNHTMTIFWMTLTPRMAVNALLQFLFTCKILSCIGTPKIIITLCFPVCLISNTDQMLKKGVKLYLLLQKQISLLSHIGTSCLNVAKEDLLLDQKWETHYFPRAWRLMQLWIRQVCMVSSGSNR